MNRSELSAPNQQVFFFVFFYLQWERDGVVAVAREEVGKDGFHGGLLLHLAVSGAQQVSVKHI